MEKKILPQEGLKLIACVTMLLDHMGAVFFPNGILLRVIGRLAFPIYCFLLAEGAHYTRNPVKYGLRLLVGLILSEIPFDLALYGRISWDHQSVMVTLLLGFLMALCMRKAPLWTKALLVIPFAILAELLRTDYGSMGVLIIAVFVITRDMENRLLFQAIGVGAICFSMFTTSFIQPLATFAMIPIAMYSGKKRTSSPAVQWAFYLFYPAHLAVLWLIAVVF